MTTYHVLFSAVVDADAEDTAVEEARLLISQPKYEPLEISDITAGMITEVAE